MPTLTPDELVTIFTAESIEEAMKAKEAAPDEAAGLRSEAAELNKRADTLESDADVNAKVTIEVVGDPIVTQVVHKLYADEGERVTCCVEPNGNDAGLAKIGVYFEPFIRGNSFNCNRSGYWLPVSELRKAEAALTDKESTGLLGRPSILDIVSTILKHAPGSSISLTDISCASDFHPKNNDGSWGVDRGVRVQANVGARAFSIDVIQNRYYEGSGGCNFRNVVGYVTEAPTSLLKGMGSAIDGEFEKCAIVFWGRRTDEGFTHGPKYFDRFIRDISELLAPTMRVLGRPEGHHPAG